MVDTPLIRKTGDGKTPANWLQPMIDSTRMLEPEAIAEAVLDFVRDDTLVGECRVVRPPDSE